jgi:hypothetical protein
LPAAPVIMTVWPLKVIVASRKNVRSRRYGLLCHC